MSPLEYVVSEAISMLYLIIIFSANIVNRSKLRNMRKQNVFSTLCIVNMMALVTDIVSYVFVHYNYFGIIYHVFAALSYSVPFLICAVFVNYLYCHISSKTHAGNKPFKAGTIASYILFGLSLALYMVGLHLSEGEAGLYFFKEYGIVYMLSFAAITLYTFVLSLAFSQKSQKT